MFEKVAECPICRGTDFKNELICQDNLTSEESFVLTDCQSCGFRITNPRPDPSSIAKYYPSDQYLPHQAKAVSFFQLAYIAARRFNLSWKSKLINNIFQEPGTLLDYGAGTGEFIQKMKKSGWKAEGIEPNQNAIQIAQNKLGISLISDKDQLTDNQLFNLVTLWHVLEHLHNINEEIQWFSEHLAINGKILIAVPNYESYDANIYGDHWAAYDVPRHLYHFNQKTMKNFLQNNGLTIEATLPMKLDAYYVSLLSEKNIKSARPSIKGLVSGYRSNRWAKENNNNYSSLVYIAKK